MKRQKSKKDRLVRILSFISWAIILSLIYTQAPLYTSNQNLYFLHGSASAGVGFLDQDWLANTKDPTPIFSLLVDLTYRVLDPKLFYFYYVFLFGVYLSSLYGIVTRFIDLEQSKTKRFGFVTLFLLLHSVVLRFILINFIGLEWAYLFDGGVANQRLLGSVFQPSCFGVLLLLSLNLFLQRRVRWAVVTAAMAASIHPTYLLSVAILTLAYMMYEIREKSPVNRTISLGFLSLVLVTPILIYTFLNFSPTSDEATAQAQKLLVGFRIPHHAILSEWFNGSVVVKLILVLVGLFITRKSRFFLVLATVSCCTLVITLFQVISRSDQLALIFPWRPSVFLVPISTSLVCAYSVDKLFNHLPKLSKTLLRPTEILFLFMLNIIMLAGLLNSYLDITDHQTDPARPLWNQISEHRQSGEVYLIPPKMQEFRLQTGVPAFVDFKSHPYKDIEVLEWYQRILISQHFYRNEIQYIDCRLLNTAQEIAGVTHVILGQAQFGLQCDQLKLVYTDQNYALLTLINR